MEYQAIYPSVWENASRKDEIFSYAEGYKVFLNCCKTERDAVRYIRTLALENGFADAGDETGNRFHRAQSCFPASRTRPWPC